MVTEAMLFFFFLIKKMNFGFEQGIWLPIKVSEKAGLINASTQMGRIQGCHFLNPRTVLRS